MTYGVETTNHHNQETTMTTSTDLTIADLARTVAANPNDQEAVDRLRHLRIRAGLESVPTSTYRVLELNMTGLRKKVASYAKRAAKLGVIALEMHVSEERFFEHRGNTVLVARDVTITGDAPDLGDWRLIARFEHLKDETVVRMVGMGRVTECKDEVDAFRQRGPVCDHCKVRRIRKDTYAVRHHTTGEVLQVGRTCLQEFCGENPKGALYLFNADNTLRGLAQAANKVIEFCKACKVDVVPVVTLDSPHGTCPSCNANLEGTAQREGCVLTSRLMMGFASDRYGSDYNAWRIAARAEMPNWSDEQKDVILRRSTAAICWAQTATGNSAAVLRDLYVENRHLMLASTGFNAAQRGLAQADDAVDALEGPVANGELPTVQFANVSGTWCVRGPASQVVVGALVRAVRKSGFTEVKRITRVIRTSRGTAFATFEDADSNGGA